MARRIVVYYKIERVLQQFLLSKAFKIQRLFRGHRVRLTIPYLLKARDDERVMQQYADFAEKRRLKKLRSDTIIKTKAAYIKERGRGLRDSQAASTPALHNNRKMKAFSESCYSDDRPTARKAFAGIGGYRQIQADQRRPGSARLPDAHTGARAHWLRQAGLYRR